MKLYKFRDIVIGDEGLLKGPFGSDLKKSLYVPKSESTYKVYLQENILKKDILCGSHYISNEYFHNSMSRYEVKEGDFIVTCDGTLGEIFQLVNIKEKGIISSSLLRITLDPLKADNKFFKYFWIYRIKNPLIRSHENSVLKHLPGLNVIRNFEFEIPDLPTQKAIAKVLSDLDAKIEFNNQINRELEAMAKTLYDYWFVQFDFPNEAGKPYKASGGKMVYSPELKREIPEGWELKKIEDFCRIFTGKKDVNQALESGKYKFFSCSPNYKFSDDLLYEGKAILISGNGSYTGRTFFVDEGFDLYQRTYACVNKTEIDILPYIYHTILRFLSVKINGGTHGSAIPYIVYNDIAKEYFPFNRDVIFKFQKIAYPILMKTLLLNKQTLELASLRDWLLPMLMNGQASV